VDLKRLKSEIEFSSDLLRLGNGQEISTREILETEKYLIDFVNAGKGTSGPLNPHYFPSDKLGNDQRQAINHILKSFDRCTGIRGLAGTGKTTILSELSKALRPSGYAPLFCAPTASATDVLRKDGFNAITLQMLLTNSVLQSRLSSQTVLIVDEAGLVGIDDMRKVFELAESKDLRVILSGDTGQHASVPRGDALRILERYSHYEYAELNEIRRQRDSEYRNAVKLASQKETVKAFASLEKKGCVTESDKLYEAAAAAYVDTVKNKKEVAMVVPTWTEINLVTPCIREELKKQRIIDQKEHTFHVLDSLSWTSAQKGNSQQYKAGQQIVFHRPNGCFQENETVEVIGVRKKALRVRRADGSKATLRPERPESFDVCEARRLNIAVGDKLLLQANRHDLINGQIVEVGKIENGKILLSDGRILPPVYRRFSYGYAVTSHSAQSKTVDEALVLAGSRSLGAIDSKQFYVSISRGRDRCRIFTDDRQMLRGWICQDRNRKAAIELMELKRVLKKTGVLPARQTIEPTRKRARLELIPEFVHRYLQKRRQLHQQVEPETASQRITKGVRI
jgi:ATP-dependent exoDNAse (exonuclease V) alpha subunit